ncbi:hypothetical protein CLV33_103185 [Jejuia pallidilutea]|uniref:TonB-dependent receptor plug domain-containing protein n=1 Tax=Jejuia pallidilutea TaxID=504487 RepID=A0A362X4L9_9FLAO|nr:hypothetical protein [Jejuia pallidilutea]PQV49549.1 hypothetical protein CLV33_103185 [Jejuia pallidilutea]
MLKTLTRIKKQTKNIFLVFVVLTTFLSAQNNNLNLEIEKTYVHTDRTTYTLGETLWYKTYTVYAHNNLLFDNSKILYVELISSDSKIIARNHTRLVAGLGNGDFKLTEKLGVKPGKYQIKAYTNWMRNFGEDFVFKKEIEVLDIYNAIPKTVNTAITSGDKNTPEIKKPKFNIQFFPEGGSLLKNVSSVVAFKAVDLNGNPIQVQGQILDEKGEIITFFSSVHDGMGKFQLKPTSGKNYFAKVTTTNQDETKEPLPSIINEGFSLGYKVVKGKKIISIQTNAETLLKYSKKPITISYSSRGVTYFVETLELTDNKLFIELPEDNLPEGINQITLLDDALRPQSERLVYVEKNKDVKVKVSTNKTIYKPKEKVAISVSSKNSFGEAVAASFSIAGIDLNGAEKASAYGTNISSYFLMESDIKGDVYNPGYYFNPNNPNRLQYLDILLLTQGWRDFLWKQHYKLDNNRKYNVEKGINITGIVKKIFGKKPVIGNTVSLSLIGKRSLKSLNAITNSKGEFKFENLDIIGTNRIHLKTTNKNGKETGMLVLDSIFKAPITTDYKGGRNALRSMSQNTTIAQNIYKKHVEFKVDPENILDEIEIVAKKKPTPSFYGKLDYSFDIDENSPTYANVYQLIEATIPNVVFEEESGFRFIRNSGPALLVINGKRTDYVSDLDFLLPDDILKLEASNGPRATMIFGNEASNGAIIIYTKRNITGQTKENLQVIETQINGYHQARIFYTPDLNYENSEEHKEDAIRNTVYWNPYVHPDKTGVFNGIYYNTAVETNVKITLEGITANGIPIVVNTYYTIEE